MCINKICSSCKHFKSSVRIWEIAFFFLFYISNHCIIIFSARPWQNCILTDIFHNSTLYTSIIESWRKIHIRTVYNLFQRIPFWLIKEFAPYIITFKIRIKAVSRHGKPDYRYHSLSLYILCTCHYFRKYCKKSKFVIIPIYNKKFLIRIKAA